jgi:hypothetical protein
MCIKAGTETIKNYVEIIRIISILVGSMVIDAELGREDHSI